MFFRHIAGVSGRDALAALIADSVMVFVRVRFRRIFSGNFALGAMGRAVVRPRVRDAFGKVTVLTADGAVLGAGVLVGVRDLSFRTAYVTRRVAVVVVYVMRFDHSRLTAYVTRGVALAGVGVRLHGVGSYIFTIHTMLAAIGLEGVRGNSRLAADITFGIAGVVVSVRSAGGSLLLALGAGSSADAEIGVCYRRNSLRAALVADLVAVAVIDVRGSSRLAADGAGDGAMLFLVGVRCRCGTDMVAVRTVRLAVVTVVVMRRGILFAAFSALADKVALSAGLVTVGGKVVRRVRSCLFAADLTGRVADRLIFMLCGTRVRLAAHGADRIAGMFKGVRRDSLVAALIAHGIAIVVVFVIVLLSSAILAGRVAACARVLVCERIRVRSTAQRADLVAEMVEVMRRVRSCLSVTDLARRVADRVVDVVGNARLMADVTLAVAVKLEGVIDRRGARLAAQLALRLAGISVFVGRIRTGHFAADLAGRVAVRLVGVRGNSRLAAYVTVGIAGVVVGVVALLLAADGAGGVAFCIRAEVVIGGCGILRTADGAGLVADVSEGVTDRRGTRLATDVAGRVAVARVGVTDRPFALITADVADCVAVTGEDVRCFADLAAHVALFVARIGVGVLFRRRARLSAGDAMFGAGGFAVIMFRLDLIGGAGGTAVGAHFRTVGDIAMRRNSRFVASFALCVTVRERTVVMVDGGGVLFAADGAVLGAGGGEGVRHGCLARFTAQLAQGLAVVREGMRGTCLARSAAVVTGGIAVGREGMRDVFTRLFTDVALVYAIVAVGVRGFCGTAQTAHGAEFGAVVKIGVFRERFAGLVADVALTVARTGEGVSGRRRARFAALAALGRAIAEVGVFREGLAHLAALVAGRVAKTRELMLGVIRACFAAHGAGLRTGGNVSMRDRTGVPADLTDCRAGRLVHVVGYVAFRSADIADRITGIVVYMPGYSARRTAYVTGRIAGVVVLMLGDPRLVAERTLGRTVVFVCMRRFAYRTALVAGVVTDVVVYVLAGRRVRLAERAGGQTEEQAEHREEQQDFLFHENLPYSIY